MVGVGWLDLREDGRQREGQEEEEGVGALITLTKVGVSMLRTIIL